MQKEYEFYEPKKHVTVQEANKPGSLYSAVIEMDSTIVYHKRSIYTFWDFLGDVGGLFEMLKLLAYPLTLVGSVLLGSGLDHFLIE